MNPISANHPGRTSYDNYGSTAKYSEKSGGDMSNRRTRLDHNSSIMSGAGSQNKGSQFYSVVAQDIELNDGDLAQDMNRNTYQINMSKLFIYIL